MRQSLSSRPLNPHTSEEYLVRDEGRRFVKTGLFFFVLRALPPTVREALHDECVLIAAAARPPNDKFMLSCQSHVGNVHWTNPTRTGKKELTEAHGETPEEVMT